MSKAIRLAQPFLERRDDMPDEYTKAACVDWDHFIESWNTQLGISDHDSDDES